VPGTNEFGIFLRRVSLKLVSECHIMKPLRHFMIWHSLVRKLKLMRNRVCASVVCMIVGHGRDSRCRNRRERSPVAMLEALRWLWRAGIQLHDTHPPIKQSPPHRPPSAPGIAVFRSPLAEHRLEVARRERQRCHGHGLAGGERECGGVARAGRELRGCHCAAQLLAVVADVHKKLPPRRRGQRQRCAGDELWRARCYGRATLQQRWLPPPLLLLLLLLWSHPMVAVMVDLHPLRCLARANLARGGRWRREQR